MMQACAHVSVEGSVDIFNGKRITKAANVRFEGCPDRPERQTETVHRFVP